MSTSGFKNYYIIGLVLILLFGVGVGYQLGITFYSPDTDTTEDADSIPTNAVIADQTPTAQPEIYVRSGRVASVNPNQITFVTYVQNSDSSYAQVTMTAQLTEDTTFTKISLRDANSAAEDISVSDIPVGSEVAVACADNIYGKTSFTASNVQLHQE